MNNVTRCGFVAIVGRPNVGKSTLLNRFIEKKISITSRKPQTTRYQILGIKTSENLQIIYVDTPGVSSELTRPMNRYMNRVARTALNEVQVVLFVVDALRFNDNDAWVLSQIEHTTVPVILVINKIDRMTDRQALLPYIDQLSRKFNFYKFIPISAKTGDQVDNLEKEIIQLLPEGPFQFPAEQSTDQDDQFMASEVIREKLMRQLGQEIPYAISVSILAFEKSPKIIRISAIIWIEKKGQKGIVIGKGGERLKKVGQNARLDLEKYYGQKVYLQLWVKLKSDWSSHEDLMKELGYE